MTPSRPDPAPPAPDAGPDGSKPEPAIECHPDRMGGVPTLRGRRFAVAQVLAELADGSFGVHDTVPAYADNYDLDEAVLRAALKELASALDRPFAFPFPAPAPDAAPDGGEAFRLLLDAGRAVLDCPVEHDSNGHAFIKVPCRSLEDVGAKVSVAVRRVEIAMEASRAVPSPARPSASAEADAGEPLAPCPFCGGEARIAKRLGCTDHYFYRVKCQSCTATDGSDDPGAAVAAWNRRPSAPPADDAGRLKAALTAARLLADGLRDERDTAFRWIDATNAELDRTKAERDIYREALRLIALDSEPDGKWAVDVAAEALKSARAAGEGDS
jgi:Lar family restriction alleviation protein